MKIIFTAEINILIAKNMILECNFQVINHKNKHFGDQKLGSDDNLKLNFVYKCPG